MRAIDCSDRCLSEVPPRSRERLGIAFARGGAGRLPSRAAAGMKLRRLSSREPAHDRRRACSAHPRRRGLGRRDVRDLCLPASGARHAGAAGAPAADAGHVPEVLSLGVDGDPVAARQRLLVAVRDLRRLCRRRPAHPPDAGDRLGDDRAVRLAVPRTVAGAQARRRGRGLAERRGQASTASARSSPSTCRSACWWPSSAPADAPGASSWMRQTAIIPTDPACSAAAATARDHQAREKHP